MNKTFGCYVWSFLGNTRMHQALNNYGDRIEAVGIFTFEVDITGTITETGTSVASLSPYRTKWPHIRWYLTIMNHGDPDIFTALRNNTGGAKTKFLSEIIRIMVKYPWCTGVDIDLERGGNIENREAANQLFADIYSTVKNYNPNKLVHVDLPGMTGVNESVGGENWCVYEDINQFCDSAAIMSYGMAWAGSAPGPVSPRDWLEGIYNYASTVMAKEKLYLGFPGYGWEWQIYAKPEDIGKTYRGVSLSYYGAKGWADGGYNFTGDAQPQPMIPFIGYWDSYENGPYMLPHIYDYCEGGDFTIKDGPLTNDTYKRKSFLTCYGKSQKTEFENTIIDRDGENANSYTGMSMSNGVATLNLDTSTALYSFTVPMAGTYDVAIKISFPFWDKNSIRISLDGVETAITENRLWWPYWRATCWHMLAKGKTLTAGTHTLEIKGGIAGVRFYGFRVCGEFTQNPYAGQAEFQLYPRSFKDVNGNMAVPDKGFRLTTEVLRRKPDSALVWYEDFRDELPLATSYWLQLSGEWSVWKENSSESRPYAQLEGNGQLAWNYNSFDDIHLRTKIAFPQGSSGKAGVFIGDVFLAINIDNQCVELYQGNTLLNYWQSEFEKTPDDKLRNEPTMYQIEFRKRGNKVRVYTGTASTLRFISTITATSGYCGIKAENTVVCELLRLGDAWTYEPYEAFDMVLPNGTTVNYGRVPRTNITWHDDFDVFSVNSDIEESDTRDEEISMDYDFMHSEIMVIPCNADYSATFIPKDINLWCSRLFLGDGDGFAICYYQDADSIVAWANEAKYRWGLRGFALWSLGQEDMRLWDALPEQMD